MVYAHDKWLELPTKDIYDTQMMLAAINAAKDMYDKGQKQMEDFYKTYGDFTSPFAKDIEDYNNLVTKPVQDAMNYMYENGIDPTRSAEGRAMLSRLIYSVPVDKVNKLRESAETGKEYQKNLAKLQAAGLYDPAQEQWRLNKAGVPSFDDFSTLDNGVWGQVSPMERGDLFELTNPSIKDIDDIILTKEDVQKLQPGTWKPGRNYMGVREEDLLNIINERMPGLKGDPRLGYFLDNARDRAAIQLGPNATQQEIEDEATKIFAQDVLTANHKHVGVHKEEVDPYAMAAYSASLSARYSGSGRSSSGGGEGDKSNHNHIPYTNRIQIGFNNKQQKTFEGYTKNSYNFLRDAVNYFSNQAKNRGDNKSKWVYAAKVLNMKGLPSDLDKMNEKQTKVVTDLLTKIGMVDKDGFFTDNTRVNLQNYLSTKLSPDQVYDMYTRYPTGGTKEAKVLTDAYYGYIGSQNDAYPAQSDSNSAEGSKIKHGRINLSQGGWQFTPRLKFAVSHRRNSNKERVFDAFNTYIRGIEPYADKQLVGSLTNLGSDYYINGTVRISRAQYEDFIREAKESKKLSGLTDVQIRKYLGLRQQQETNGINTTYYYTVPMTRHIDNNTLVEINREMSHAEEGQSGVVKNEAIDIDSAIQNAQQ